jgi:hypothetical protein
MQTAFRSRGADFAIERLGSGLRSGPSPYRLLAAGALLAAALIPPGVADHGPVTCPFRLMTGIPCPSCGLTRSWVALMHGSLSESVAYHPLGPVVAVVAVLFALNADRLIPGLTKRLSSPRFLGAVGGVWIAIWAVRLGLGWL